MKNLVFLLTLLTIQSNAQKFEFFEVADNFFMNNVDERGMVSYQSLAQAPQSLNELYHQVGKISLDGKSDSFKKALYINAYNICVIKSIVDSYPVDGPMKIDGFFDSQTHLVGGERLTLNQIEKEKNLKVYGDERIHFVLVCAAMSCPPLAQFAFKPEELDKQLESRTRVILNTDFIKTSSNQVLLSRIFEWYKSDFEKGNNSLLDYINEYRNNKIHPSASIDFYEYDWNLNVQR